MIKLKDILKESIGGLVTIPAINPPMNFEKKEPVQELEYEPGNYKAVIGRSMELAKELNKMRNQIRRDVDNKERKALDNVINDFQDYFSSLKKFSKAIK
tara:strand:- start:446 stop:742 length:297 start_codon:yes stop_codon:yes gene_type:complete